MSTLTTLIRRIQSPMFSRAHIIELAARNNIGSVAFDALRDERDDTQLQALPGWPECGCLGCGCHEPATQTDDGGVPVCDECSEYTVDAEGDVHCSRCDDVETVVESCGAGNQTRSYVRLRPPEMPTPDVDGRYALYWDTAGDDARVVARFATAEQAEQAVAAKNWPAPGDHTHYLCGYEVRELVDGEWARLEME